MAEVLAIGGGGLALARGRELTLYRIEGDEARACHQVASEVDVWRLHVAAGGEAAIFGDRDRAWAWTAAGGVRPLAVRNGPREQFGVGFAGVEGDAPVVLVAQRGQLTATSLDGAPRFTAVLREPRSFYCERFVELPAGHLALHGVEFSDPFDTVIVVELAALARDPQAVQTALAARKPLVDRAPRVVIGRGPGATAVVYRDPEEEEPHDPDDEPDELPDVWGFRGFYVRDLATGKLLERVPHTLPLSADAELTATSERFLVRSAATLSILDRSGQAVERIHGRAVALDPVSGVVAVVGDDGTLQVMPGRAGIRSAGARAGA